MRIKKEPEQEKYIIGKGMPPPEGIIENNKYYNPETIMPLDRKETAFLEKAEEIAKLVMKKNRAYGDSFVKAGNFLKLLYPDGIELGQYEDMLTIVRVFDKMMRIAIDKDALGESPWQDINGYSLLAIVTNEIKKGE